MCWIEWIYLNTFLGLIRTFQTHPSYIYISRYFQKSGLDLCFKNIQFYPFIIGSGWVISQKINGIYKIDNDTKQYFFKRITNIEIS